MNTQEQQMRRRLKTMRNTTTSIPKPELTPRQRDRYSVASEMGIPDIGKELTFRKTLMMSSPQMIQPNNYANNKYLLELSPTPATGNFLKANMAKNEKSPRDVLRSYLKRSKD